MIHLQLRNAFSKFWENRKHKEVPPIPLVTENDPTTLFNGSGMQQLVPYLLGEKHPLGNRLYNIQRAFRTQDIEKVGDNRHTTFFEMMGNWSLGDYFKEEQLSWFWEFLTKELNLSKDKLHVTVFEGNKDVPKDKESISIWRKLGVPTDRIRKYPASKNWWSRTGEPKNMSPNEIGGPDSEVFYEFTNVKHDPKFGKICHPNCDCGRFLEIGNSVFMEYKMNNNRKLEPLPKKNVDFGGGLERILAAVNNDPDMFKIDVIWPIVESVTKLSNKPYDTKNQSSMRVIADHMRASVMLVSDGVIPSNKDQGYVLRRLIRRSIRNARNLDLEKGFTKPIAESAIEIFKDTYPHVEESRDKIITELINEEEKFEITLEKGMKKYENDGLVKLESLVNEYAKTSNFLPLGKALAGIASRLHQSHGLPIDIVIDRFDEKFKMVYDSELYDRSIIYKEFEKLNKRHQEASRKGLSGKFHGGLADSSEQTVKLHTATHLLHQSLRNILGSHVQQKGSNITVKRLRFDFLHSKKMTNDQIKHVENMINDQIAKKLPVIKEITTYEKAIKDGALAFFGERYPEKVNVYSIGSFSKEICGGPHVSNTNEIGHITIEKEQSAGAGIRRIYAILE